MQYIIGDIHGCFETLSNLIARIKASDTNPSFVFIGDYVDRGLRSKEVIEFLLNLEKQHSCVFLRGNHDDVVNWIIYEEANTPPSEWVAGPPTLSKVVDWWCYNGFITTLESYGVELKDGDLFDIIGLKFREQIPEEHKEFFSRCKMFWENETHFACHAFLPPTMELPRSLKFLRTENYYDMLWGRFKSVNNTLDTSIKINWDKIGVFGHTPVQCYGAETAIKYDKLRLIDTGVCFGNYLTAYIVELDDFILESTVSSDIRG